MLELTRQTKAPCIDVDGNLLADFGADELDVWWTKMGFALP
jgi:glutaredoxin 3